MAIKNCLYESLTFYIYAVYADKEIVVLCEMFFGITKTRTMHCLIVHVQRDMYTHSCFETMGLCFRIAF